MNLFLLAMRLLATSETRALCLVTVAAMVSPFIPRKMLIPLLVLEGILSRLVARGSRNRCRPVNCADPEDAKRRSRFVMREDMPTEERPLALVTGTNSGIGYYTAVGLAAEGYLVVVTCRSKALTQETADRIRVEAQRQRTVFSHRYLNSPKYVAVVGLMPIECDDFAGIRSFADWFITSFANHNFQVLVNNAGGMSKILGYSKFNPQLELHTAVNFLGPMLLTELLLPLLEKNGGRVVYVSSVAHNNNAKLFKSSVASSEPATLVANDALNGRLLQALKEINQGKALCAGPLGADSFSGAFIRYGTSKLLNTYHAHLIARRYRSVPDPRHRVLACSLHPGVVKTGFTRGWISSRFLEFLFKFIGIFFLKNTEEGAQTSLHCAMCPLDELELVAASATKDGDAAASKKEGGQNGKDNDVSPYFVECANQTKLMLGKYGWDVKEAEMVIAWGKKLVGLS